MTNRLEKHFRAAQNSEPASKGAGEEGGTAGIPLPRELLELHRQLAGNYLALEMERARWEVMHEHQDAGKPIEECWNSPVFQALDKIAINELLKLPMVPFHSKTVSAVAVQHHYRELMTRLRKNPEAADTEYPEATVCEILCFLLEGLNVGITVLCEMEEKTELLCCLLYRCLERIYGTRDTLLFMELQVYAAKKDEQPEGEPVITKEARERLEAFGHTVEQATCPMRQAVQLIDKHIDRHDFSNNCRKAMDNMLSYMSKYLLTVRHRLGGKDVIASSEALEYTRKAAASFTKHQNWQGWLEHEGE